MKLVAFTDLHIKGVSPRSRKDDYYKAVLKKLSFVVNYANSVQADAVLCMGDLFDLEVISHGVENDVITILKELNSQIYHCLGSHEYSSYNLSTLRRTIIGVLNNLGFIHILHEPIKLVSKDISVVLHATHHTYNLDKDPLNYAINRRELVGDHHIQLVHGMLLPNSAPFEYTLLDNLPRNQIGDLLLVGHYHPGYRNKILTTYEDGTVRTIEIINPGSLGRAEETTRDLLILDIDVTKTDLIVNYIPVPHEKDVFEESIASKKTDVERAAMIASFLDNLAAQSELSTDSDLETTFKTVATKLGKSSESLEFLLNYLHEKNTNLVT